MNWPTSSLAIWFPMAPVLPYIDTVTLAFFHYGVFFHIFLLLIYPYLCIYGVFLEAAYICLVFLTWRKSTCKGKSQPAIPQDQVIHCPFNFRGVWEFPVLYLVILILILLSILVLWLSKYQSTLRDLILGKMLLRFISEVCWQPNQILNTGHLHNEKS